MMPNPGLAALLPAAFTALTLSFAGPGGAAPAASKLDLAPHRAVYDLKLGLSRGNRPVESIRGRILYDFTGNACEGYALQFRQVSELNMGESANMFTDLRATTWEDAEAKSFRFNSQNFINEKLVDSVDGQADRRPGDISIALKKPAAKSVKLDAALVFPTEHMRRIIEAARDGKTFLDVPVYDGSETGEKQYNTLAVIGQKIAPEAARPADAAGADPELSKLPRWPIRISYFDKTKSGGEQLPVYAISFELYENGVSRALSLDYNDFVVSGEMTALELKKPTPCR